MVVHYLYDNNLIPKLAEYFDLRHSKNLPVEEAIQQAFGMSAAKFDKQIVQYVASNEFRYYQMNTPADIETKGYTTLPVGGTDAASLIADIHAHSRDYQDKAVAEFEEILKTDPNNAAACRGMGYVYLQKRDLDQAREYFQRAAKADSKDSRVHYYSGVLMNVKGSGSRSELAAATEELKAAIALDPDFADAYMQLAYMQRRTGDISEAMANAKKAVSLSPRNQSYYFNIADLYLQQRKVPEAMSIYRALAKSSDPMIASRASGALAQTEQMEAAMKQAESAQVGASEERQHLTLHLAPGTAAGPNSSASPPSPPAASPVKFLKGTIVSVDCTSAPGAVLTVASSGKRWTTQVSDRHHVLVLGADGFSCNWSGQKVALNYRETGESAGSVVSIEIQ
jgi:tetratricopeptide (TPR) repeat protein